MMIFTRAVLVYLTFVISHITTAFEGFHMETLMTERKTECERSLKHIEDVIEGEEQSKHFWLKSALHDNQILTGKLNNILIGVGYRKSYTSIHTKNPKSKYFQLQFSVLVS